MISPGYYSQECNAHKQCKDAVKYCHMFLCVDCLKENVACTQNGQCCPSSECIYGRCKTGASAGQAGKTKSLMRQLVEIRLIRWRTRHFAQITSIDLISKRSVALVRYCVSHPCFAYAIDHFLLIPVTFHLLQEPSATGKVTVKTKISVVSVRPPLIPPSRFVSPL